MIKREIVKRKIERKKEQKVRCLPLLLKSLKEEKIKVKKKERKKERKKESCDLWFATSKEKGKESWQVVEKVGWRHNGTVSSVVEFVCLAMYLLNQHW